MKIRKRRHSGLNILGLLVCFMLGPEVTAGKPRSLPNMQVAGNAILPVHSLRLEAIGSFFVGGRSVEQTDAEVGLYHGGPITVDQMYVEFMRPEKISNPAIVMIHGATLTGASYESTPDGRMGWYEYFVRRGFPSYVVDQIGRGRSGFNQASFNNVRAGVATRSGQANLRRLATDVAWVRFRFGPVPGVRFPDSQFPTEAAAELAKQAVPDLDPSPEMNEANYAALGELTARLQRTILLGHSQTGRFPFETALRHPQGIRALVAVEPGGCNGRTYTDDQIRSLAKLPILVVFGDHIGDRPSVGPDWRPIFEDCQAFITRINAAHGTAKMLVTTELGVFGNSHMLMQDRNNLQIADAIIAWLKNTSR